MLLPNLYGNIVSNIGASLVGGPGVVPGENYGPDYAVFESVSRYLCVCLSVCLYKNLTLPFFYTV